MSQALRPIPWHKHLKISFASFSLVDSNVARVGFDLFLDSDESVASLTIQVRRRKSGQNERTVEEMICNATDKLSKDFAELARSLQSSLPSDYSYEE